jgi:hypothetical protein
MASANKCDPKFIEPNFRHKRFFPEKNSIISIGTIKGCIFLSKTKKPGLQKKYWATPPPKFSHYLKKFIFIHILIGHWEFPLAPIATQSAAGHFYPLPVSAPSRCHCPQLIHLSIEALVDHIGRCFRFFRAVAFFIYLRVFQFQSRNIFSPLNRAFGPKFVRRAENYLWM